MITNLNPLERYSAKVEDAACAIVVTRRSDGKTIAFSLSDEDFQVDSVRLEGLALIKKAIAVAKNQPGYVWG